MCDTRGTQSETTVTDHDLINILNILPTRMDSYLRKLFLCSFKKVFNFSSAPTNYENQIFCHGIIRRWMFISACNADLALFTNQNYFVKWYKWATWFTQYLTGTCHNESKLSSWIAWNACKPILHCWEQIFETVECLLYKFQK